MIVGQEIKRPSRDLVEGLKALGSATIAGTSNRISDPELSA